MSIINIQELLALAKSTIFAVMEQRGFKQLSMKYDSSLGGEEQLVGGDGLWCSDGTIPVTTLNGVTVEVPRLVLRLSEGRRAAKCVNKDTTTMSVHDFFRFVVEMILEVQHPDWTNRPGSEGEVIFELEGQRIRHQHSKHIREVKTTDHEF